MRGILTLFFLLVITGKVWSQQEFVFIQAEANHPFYVRIGNSTYSSSALGHIILAPLKDSSYQIFIGFARNEFPEQEFRIRLSKKDRGFELRRHGNEEWNLVEWQTMQTIQAIPVKARQDTSLLNEARRSDPFANLMAGLVNDSTVLYTSVRNESKSTAEPQTNIKEPAVAVVPAKDVAAPITSAKTADTPNKKAAVNSDTTALVQKKPDTVKSSAPVTAAAPPITSAKTADTPTKKAVANSDTTAFAQRKPDTVKSSAPVTAAAPPIIKILENTVGEGLQLKFLVRDSTLTDTVDVLIVADKTAWDAPSAKKETATSQFGDTQTTAKSAAADTAKTKKEIVLENSDCRSFATDQDVDKLRIQMMKSSTDDDRLNAAKKMFRQKCYTAKQVKALSELFPTDEGRYRFFDTAYPFVSDSGNFRSLVEMLTDPDYIDRFNKLVRGA